jgi:hypothetical protein
MLLRRDCSIQGLSIPSSTKLNELNFYLLVSLGDYSDLTVFAVLLQARQLFLCSQCIHTIIARILYYHFVSVRERFPSVVNFKYLDTWLHTR